VAYLQRHLERPPRLTAVSLQPPPPSPPAPQVPFGRLMVDDILARRDAEAIPGDIFSAAQHEVGIRAGRRSAWATPDCETRGAPCKAVPVSGTRWS
jgi:hypothetical protein